MTRGWFGFGSVFAYSAYPNKVCKTAIVPGCHSAWIRTLQMCNPGFLVSELIKIDNNSMSWHVVLGSSNSSLF
jgi:hypothetical protein